MVWYGTLCYVLLIIRPSAVEVQYGTIWYVHGMVQYGAVWYGTVLLGMVRYCTAQDSFGIVRHVIISYRTVGYPVSTAVLVRSGLF